MQKIHLYKSTFFSIEIDFLMFVGTFLCCLFISLEYGIIIGIGVNLIFILYANTRPKLHIEREKVPYGNVFLVQTKTAWHYTAAEHVRETVLKECTQDYSKFIVIDGKSIGNIDSTVAKVNNGFYLIYLFNSGVYCRLFLI